MRRLLTHKGVCWNLRKRGGKGVMGGSRLYTHTERERERERVDYRERES